MQNGNLVDAIRTQSIQPNFSCRLAQRPALLSMLSAALATPLASPWAASTLPDVRLTRRMMTGPSWLVLERQHSPASPSGGSFVRTPADYGSLGIQHKFGSCLMLARVACVVVFFVWIFAHAECSLFKSQTKSQTDRRVWFGSLPNPSSYPASFVVAYHSLYHCVLPWVRRGLVRSITCLSNLHSTQD
jgi:hypothetical protein